MRMSHGIRRAAALVLLAAVSGWGTTAALGAWSIFDDEEFDEWFLDKLGRGDFSEILDLPNDELAEAGNGTGEVRAWVALAAAMGGAPGQVLSYQPIYEWINGMGVVLYEGDDAQTTT